MEDGPGMNSSSSSQGARRGKLTDQPANDRDMHAMDISMGESSPEPQDRSIHYPKGASTGLKRMLSDESFYSAKEETQVILAGSGKGYDLRCNHQIGWRNLVLLVKIIVLAICTGMVFIAYIYPGINRVCCWSWKHLEVPVYVLQVRRGSFHDSLRDFPGLARYV